MFPPGTQFSYSNTNYTILGILIEEVTGKTYSEALRERILDPLGLNDTYLAGFEEGPDPFTGYSGVFGTTDPDDFDYTAIATDAFSAGALVSSGRDLAIFLTALFDAQVVSARSLSAMTENEEYGFGIMKWDSPAGLYGHGGGIPGYGTLFAYAPATGTTAFWVTTSELVDFGPTVEPIAQLIASD